MTARVAIFAYGSLANPASAAETLGRPVQVATTARLEGWRRRWSTARDNLRSEKTFGRDDDGSLPAFTLGLNIEPAGDGDAAPNGALIEVTEAEVERLDLRELRYDRVDLTRAVSGCEGFDLVIGWTAKPAHHAPTPPQGAVVLRTYLDAVETAFGELGLRELELFRETTGAPPAEVILASLVQERIPPGNPRLW